MANRGPGLGPKRALFLGLGRKVAATETQRRIKTLRYRPCDGTPNAATVAVTTSRVSLSPCTALWSMKIKKKLFLELSSGTLPVVTATVAALGVPSHGL